MYIGQGYDLFWTFNTQRPSVEKYISMVDYSTSVTVDTDSLKGHHPLTFLLSPSS